MENLQLLNNNKMSKENSIQEVEVAVTMSGYYAAFHEISINKLWDYTNDIQLSFDSKEEVEEALDTGHDGEYSDTQMVSGILYNGKYYLDL